MRYYKIINGQLIVGVGTTSELRRIQGKTGMLVACDERLAQVIEVCGVYYHGEWMRPFYSDIPCENAQVISIDDVEYERLKEQFEDDEPIVIPDEPEPEPEDPTSEEPQVEKPAIMSGMELRQRVVELEEKNAEKDEKINMLEECILEMSEYVYA